MWPFSTPNFHRKLTDALERLEKLEREHKAIRGEWDDAYDRLMKLVGRFTKRAQQIEEHEQQESATNDSPGGAGTATSTANLDPVSKRILERRARMFPPQKERTQ